ncbi:MAG: hypothetical protein IMZ55_08955 [Acidobacteria bacterium]|nr:hypothetical protein [Acidobacteriota bacterium]
MKHGVRILAAVAAIALACPMAAAQETLTRFDIPREGPLQIVTDVVVKSPGAQVHRHVLVPESDPAAAKAIDHASGKPLATRVEGSALIVSLGRTLNDKAEQRLGIEERVPRAGFLKPQGQGLAFSSWVRLGRAVIVLPPGFAVARSSVLGQVASEGECVKLGLVKATDGALPVQVEMRPGAAGSVPIAPGGFRAEDDRNIVYWLGDPESHRIDLALELRITQPGQAHAYSVLRKEDNITNPRTLDVDRGVDLPTKIVSGAEAAALAESTFPAEAAVFVADLGDNMAAGGSARVRLYQTATDPVGYRLLPMGEIRWDRFVGRLRTRAVLPEGWALTSVDQPALVSVDERARVVIDFVQAGAGPDMRAGDGVLFP